MTITKEKIASSQMQSFIPLTKYTLRYTSITANPQDRTQQILTDHYCSRISEDHSQCLVYEWSPDIEDGKKAAKLLGTKHLISLSLFEQLPSEEQQYWHSHQEEVKQGIVHMPSVPTTTLRDTEMTRLANMYGKTIFTWSQPSQTMPMGTPSLMGSIIRKENVNKQLLQMRNDYWSIKDEDLIDERSKIKTTPIHPAADKYEPILGREGGSQGIKPSPASNKTQQPLLEIHASQSSQQISHASQASNQSANPELSASSQHQSSQVF